MLDTEARIIEILRRLPSEGPNLDYKEVPYPKTKDLYFIKDVIAMLNAETAMDKDKFIICGVDNDKNLVGIETDAWRDDNEWQNLLSKISPRPIDVRTGTIEFDNKLFGYIYISQLNNEWVYEAAESIYPPIGDRVKETNTLFKGQALTRRGSKNDTLFSKDRQRLLEKKIQSDYAEKRTIIIEPSYDEHFLGAIALLGSLNEKYEGDLEVAKYITGLTEKVLIEKLRESSSKSQDIFIFSNGVWKIKNHAEVLLKEADKIYDSHIDAFFACAKKCFAEVEPKYNLDADKRYAASIFLQNQKEKYSRILNECIAETLAVLGNNQELFVNCSENKILNELCVLIRGLFKADDWKVYASQASNFQYIGEACPSVFLDEIIRLTNEKDNAFLTFLNEKEEGITVTQYGYQLSWIISNIAKLEQYFSRAMLALFQLAKINKTFCDTIVGIVLPWYPQTHAPIAIRVGVFRGLAAEDVNLTWKLLMRLMPRATTTGSPIMKPKHLKVAEIPETVSRKDYIDATLGYINIAIEISGNDVNKLSDLLKVIDDVDIEIQKKITTKISETSCKLSQQEKEFLWNEIQDFSLRHRKYADADWALNEERLKYIDELALFILPDDSHANAIRLFREDQYSLIEEKGNYSDEENKLREKQTNILSKLYEQKGIEGIVDFSCEIENISVLGVCISGIANNDDIRFLISRSGCIEKNALLRGLFLNIDFKRIIEIIRNESDGIQAKILAFLALTKEIIAYIEKLAIEAQNQYWELTPVWGIGAEISEIYHTSVEKLNVARRTDKSIFILYNCIKEQVEALEPSLVVDTLNLNVEVASSQTVNTLDEYYIQHLIKWLQEQNINKDDMVLIEWKYLVFLQEGSGYPPTYLWNEMSSNPEYYIEIIKYLCGKVDDFKGTDEEKTRIVNQCYKLLYSWKTVPGLCIDGTFDKEVLDNWMSVVSAECKKYDVESLAMNYFGQAAFHAPKDKDGFFIEKNVARYLQSDKEGHALSGFYSEAINSRGVHTVDVTGKAEFGIEREYKEKANSADAVGMFRFADTLRKIARSYHEEGEQNIKYGQKVEDMHM